VKQGATFNDVDLHFIQCPGSLYKNTYKWALISSSGEKDRKNVNPTEPLHRNDRMPWNVISLAYTKHTEHVT
jgi:hypothetical protein